MRFFRKNIKQNRMKVRDATEGGNRYKKNRKLFLLLFKISALGSLAFLLWYVLNNTAPSNFPVKNVKIFSTYKHVAQRDLRKTIAPYLNNGFFYLNVIWMKQQLLKHPWIYAVSVQRKWPDTVVIDVVEQQAVLRWGTKALINSEGTVFAPETATFPQELPMIFGSEEREPEIFALYQKLVTLLQSLDLTVKQLVLSSQHYWEVVLSNNTVVYLKEDEPLKQLELLTKLYKKITAGHRGSPKSIDLRYRTGLAIKWE